MIIIIIYAAEIGKKNGELGKSLGWEKMETEFQKPTLDETRKSRASFFVAFRHFSVHTVIRLDTFKILDKNFSPFKKKREKK